MVFHESPWGHGATNNQQPSTQAHAGTLMRELTVMRYLSPRKVWVNTTEDQPWAHCTLVLQTKPHPPPGPKKHLPKLTYSVLKENFNFQELHLPTTCSKAGKDGSRHKTTVLNHLGTSQLPPKPLRAHNRTHTHVTLQPRGSTSTVHAPIQTNVMLQHRGNEGRVHTPNELPPGP